MRAQESAKPAGERLFDDPCARVLAGPGMLMLTTGTRYPSVNETVVLRTRAIDEEIGRFVEKYGHGQLVIVGAGFDCRAFRLPCLSVLRVFELDFQAVLNEKLQLLGAQEFKQPCCASHHPLGCDLSQAGWQQHLSDHAEFRASEPTLYLLEGFCGYLKESELTPLLRIISKLASGPSLLIATWIAPGFESHTTLHQFFTAAPGKFLEGAGWQCLTEVSVGELALKYNRTALVKPDNRTFFMTIAQPAPAS